VAVVDGTTHDVAQRHGDPHLLAPSDVHCLPCIHIAESARISSIRHSDARRPAVLARGACARRTPRRSGRAAPYCATHRTGAPPAGSPSPPPAPGAGSRTPPPSAASSCGSSTPWRPATAAGGGSASERRVGQFHGGGTTRPATRLVRAPLHASADPPSRSILRILILRQ
jgi:hypothetical protein